MIYSLLVACVLHYTNIFSNLKYFVLLEIDSKPPLPLTVSAFRPHFKALRRLVLDNPLVGDGELHTSPSRLAFHVSYSLFRVGVAHHSSFLGLATVFNDPPGKRANRDLFQEAERVARNLSEIAWMYGLLSWVRTTCITKDVSRNGHAMGRSGA